MGFADRNPLNRNQQSRRGGAPGASRYQSQRSYLQRPGMQNPYQPSSSRFGFGSRTSAAPAPLFHSTLDDFREEDDDEEHARHVAEHYALQRSRRQIGRSQLTESSEGDEEGARLSPLGDDAEEEDEDDYRRGRGIRSSWKGEPTSRNLKPPHVGTVKESPSRERSRGASATSSKGKSRLVDVELGSTRSEDDMDKLDGSDSDDDPPSIQNFQRGPMKNIPPQQHTWIPRETDEEAAMANPRPPSVDRESVPPNVGIESSKPVHDAVWASLYMLMMAALFGSFVLSFLENSAPDKKHPLGDTIYSTLRASFHLLGVDTLVMVIVSVLFLFVLRSAMRPLIYTVIVAVPILLISFTIYPLVSSFKGFYAGASIQDKLMRLVSFLPAIASVFWATMTWRSRHSLSRAVDILEFAARILESSPGLILLGFASLTAQVLWIWIWLLMFQRIFLGGHFRSGEKSLFIVDLGTWWLGAFFVLMYLWTQAIISGIQRATTAAVVSQWYFHRNAIPAPTSRAVVQESFRHATTVIFGTVCASTLCQLAVRVPLLLLPRRINAFVTVLVYNFFPTPVASLTNPLSLTYAAIHSQPLAAAARGLGNLSFVSVISPTTTLSPSTASDRSAPLLPYRLAKLLMHATRYVTAFAVGIVGWVSTSHSLKLAGNSGIKGSLYAYIVGMVAGAIGWSIFSAMEGVLGFVVDAVAVCWGTECAARESKDGRGDVRGGYCYEAAELFGNVGR